MRLFGIYLKSKAWRNEKLDEQNETCGEMLKEKWCEKKLKMRMKIVKKKLVQFVFSGFSLTSIFMSLDCLTF